jgi:hypothetical protein
VGACFTHPRATEALCFQDSFLVGGGASNSGSFPKSVASTPQNNRILAPLCLWRPSVTPIMVKDVIMIYQTGTPSRALVPGPECPHEQQCLNHCCFCKGQDVPPPYLDSTVIMYQHGRISESVGLISALDTALCTIGAAHTGNRRVQAAASVSDEHRVAMIWCRTPSYFRRVEVMPAHLILERLKV